MQIQVNLHGKQMTVTYETDDGVLEARIRLPVNTDLAWEAPMGVCVGRVILQSRVNPDEMSIFGFPGVQNQRVLVLSQ